MKYIDIKTVVDSYMGFQDCMTNKSWGYLALLKGCNNIIHPKASYEVNIDIVSNFLEDIFNLSQTKRHYDGGRSLYVVFSNRWEHYFKDQGRYSPNIYDVVSWAYRRKAFPDNVTKEDIINKFSIDFNIPHSVIIDSFDTQPKSISFSDTLYLESALKSELKGKGVDVSRNNIDAKKGGFVASPGEISRGPFVQTLYAGLDITDYVLILQSNYISLYGASSIVESKREESLYYEQKIYFGTPGSGKSWTIKQKYEQDETKVFRTTFHPDTDYASFVGCYKPIKDEDDEKKIVYEFVPQAFTDAYVAAWSDKENPYYLIIEEINRGNCAQIFGDLFQLLDRNKDGYSEYPIKADHDLRDYLVEHLPEDSEGIRDGKLCLPPNLSIIASMNTSDQSLFPMDSAFKRRWSWEYVPIDYENVESGTFEITVGGETYNWHEFLKAVNEKIKKVTSSEDKQMGNFFIKASVDEKEFCDKVMFYLWSEVGKDNYQTNDAIFRYYAEEDKLKEFSFNELYDERQRATILKGFIRYIEEEKK